eukprot:850958-Rhodomonas_salina.2
MPGTDIVYGAAGFHPAQANRMTLSPVCVTLVSQLALEHVTYHHVLLSGAAIAYCSSSIRACYAVSGTAMAYDAILLRASYAMAGTDTASQQTVEQGGYINTTANFSPGHVTVYPATSPLCHARY